MDVASFTSIFTAITNGAGKVVDMVTKNRSTKAKIENDKEKIACDQEKITGSLFDTIIEADVLTTEHILDAIQTAHIDIELTQEYKKSDRLDLICDLELKLISEGKMTPEIEERLRTLKEEETARKERDEDRASKERSKKRLETAVVGTAPPVLKMATFVGGVCLIIKVARSVPH